MMVQNRMSPFTALVIGIFGVGAVGITSSAAIVLYGMRIVDTKAADILGFAQGTVENLPELIKSLPPAIGELLNDRRMPEYSAELDLEVRFIAEERTGTLRPTLTITNNGSEVVSMLAVRVAALTDGAVPLREWTEVVATPIAIENEWRGPLMPGSTRHVILSAGYRGIPAERADDIVGAVEVSELRVWRSTDDL